MGFNIERVDKPFVVKSPYRPSGDQPKAIEELATRIENVPRSSSSRTRRSPRSCAPNSASSCPTTR